MAGKAVVDRRKALIIKIVDEAYKKGEKAPVQEEIGKQIAEKENAIIREKNAGKPADQQEKEIEISKQAILQYVRKMDEEGEVVYLDGQIFTDYIIEQKVKHLEDDIARKGQNINDLIKIQMHLLHGLANSDYSPDFAEDAVIEVSYIVPKFISYTALITACLGYGKEKLYIDENDEILKSGDGTTHPHDLARLMSCFLAECQAEKCKYMKQGDVEEFFAYAVSGNEQKNFKKCIAELVSDSLAYGFTVTEPEEGLLCSVYDAPGGQCDLTYFIEKLIRKEYEKTNTAVSFDKIVSDLLSTNTLNKDIDLLKKGKLLSELAISGVIETDDNGMLVPKGTLRQPKPATSEFVTYIFENIRKTTESLYDDRDRIPYVEEIADELAISKSLMLGMLDFLKKDFEVKENGQVLNEYIRENEAKKTADEKESKPAEEKTTVVFLPILGKIACGRAEMEEAKESAEKFPFPKKKLDSRNGYKDYYFLKASGDSMKNVDIKDGALVLIKETRNADYGDIVVAINEDNETTLKRYCYDEESKKAYLHPENPEYPDMFWEKITIIGKYENYIAYGF